MAPGSTDPGGPAPALPDGAVPGPEGYLFVVTYGRSGSTVLMKVLNAVPGVCVRGENGHVCHAFRKLVEHLENAHNFAWRRAATGQPLEGRPADLRDILGTPADPWYGAERIDPETVGRALCSTFVHQYLQPPAGTRIAGFKEIRYIDHVDDIPADLDFLRRFFPKARFVFLTRDHKAVMASGWNARVSPLIQRPKLRAADAAFAAYAEAHPDICHLLDYGDFAANPAGLAPLFAFLREPFDSEAVAAVLNTRLTHLKTGRPPGLGKRIALFALRQLHLFRSLLR